MLKARTLSKLAILLISTACALCAAELTLRLTGYRPWAAVQADRNEPTMNENDPVLGWRAKKGFYLVPPYDPSGAEIHYTFLEGGLRKTSEGQTDVRDARPKFIAVGCSFTQGWAISDEETYAWKLQKEFPDDEVLNYGVAGYSTYQSLLKLEQVLPVMRNPKVVLYGFSDKHEDRNVAAAAWVRRLSMYSRRGHVFVPYVSLGSEGQLTRYPPEAYPVFPLREYSSMAALAESAYAELRAKERAGGKREATQQLILQMRDLTQRYGAEFVLAFLVVNDEAKDHYQRFLAENHISAIDCSQRLSEEMIVEGEGHPNGRLNSVWAACIADSLSGAGSAYRYGGRELEQAVYGVRPSNDHPGRP